MATPCKNEFHFIAFDEAQTNEVKLGSDVTVSCPLPSEINAADMDIRWFKGTDCVCLYMEEQMIAGVGYKGRVRLIMEIESGKVSLELKDFRESDDGDYLCQVTSGGRTEKKTVKLSLKTHENTEMLQSKKTTPEKNDEKKMDKSVLMAVFTELKDTKQECKRKDAEIRELKVERLQTVGEPEKENTQQENMHKPAKELESSEPNQNNAETKTTPLEKQLNIELKDTKQECKKKVAEIEQTTHRGNTQQENIHKPAKEMENPVKCKSSELNQDNPETKTTPLEKQQNIDEVKVFTFYTGKANLLQNTHNKFIGTLRIKIPNLREVDTLDESDATLIFCPNVSRVGTDIDAALKIREDNTDNTGSKLAVLVVLHHTFDPEKVVPDSSRYVRRTDILTVDCLFYEDSGFLECQKNSDSIDKVVKWLKGRKAEANVCSHQNKVQVQGQETSKKDNSNHKSVLSGNLKKEDCKPKTKGVKMFSILPGNTNNYDQKFIKVLENRGINLRKVHTVEESEIILVFCPIVSRAGTDIEAALNKLKCHTDSEQMLHLKPTALVVLHHTFDPEKTVPDSSKCVNRTDILTVDFLFNEDSGLLPCQKNSDAADKVVNWLIQQEKQQDTSEENTQQMASTSSCPVKYFVSVTGDAQEHHEHFIKALQKEMNLKNVTKVQESDVILHFYPDITEYSKKIDKPVVLISLRHTVDPKSLKMSEIQRRGTLFPVESILHKGIGLLDCPINTEEISALLAFLKKTK